MNFGFLFNRHDSTIETRNWQEKANKSIKLFRSFREIPSDTQYRSLSTKVFLKIHLKFILKWFIQCFFASFIA